MKCGEVVFSRHALERMFQREIGPDVVKQVLIQGEVIADYPDDTPYPSQLILGYHDNRPVHLVAAQDERTEICYIVTVYEPQAELWADDYRKRKEL